MTTPHAMRAWVAALAMATVVAAKEVIAADPLSAEIVPLPSLGPQEVVRIQLEALQRNDDDDRGIAVAFRFASPDNKRNTGPLPRFAAMIKDGPYALMLRFTDASYSPVRIQDRQAAVTVTLTAPGVSPVSYLFLLSRQQRDGPLKDCWMTDGVFVVPYAGEQA